jgi:hypothetical protein
MKFLRKMIYIRNNYKAFKEKALKMNKEQLIAQAKTQLIGLGLFGAGSGINKNLNLLLRIATKKGWAREVFEELEKFKLPNVKCKVVNRHGEPIQPT